MGKVPYHLKLRFQDFVELTRQNMHRSEPKSKLGRNTIIKTIKTTPSLNSAAKVLQVSYTWLRTYCQNNNINADELREVKSWRGQESMTNEHQKNNSI